MSCATGMHGTGSDYQCELMQGSDIMCMHMLPSHKWYVRVI